MTTRRASGRMHRRVRRAVGVACSLAIAVSGCGTGGEGTGAGDVTIPGPDGSTGGEGAPAIPDDIGTDCGCDSSAPDAADDTGGDTSSAGDSGSDAGGDAAGGDAGGGGGGDGGGELRLAEERRAAAALRVPESPDHPSTTCIHGIVEDDLGRRIPGAMVQAVSDAGAVVAVGGTERAGQYCLNGERARATRIAVTTPGGVQLEHRIEAASSRKLDVHGCIEVRTVVAAHP